MGMDFYVRGFANGMARLCHRGGTTLPSWWHDFAIPLAKLCHHDGKKTGKDKLKDKLL